eukprot:8361646-Karenia_brevis.AAC.1
MIRAARDTLTVFQDCLAQLQRAAEDLLPAICYDRERPWPQFWDSPVIAWQLGDADKGLPNYKKLNGAGVRALSALDAARAASLQP